MTASAGRHGGGERPRASRRVVDFHRIVVAGIAARVETAGDQNAAVQEPRRGMVGAAEVELAGQREGAGGRIIELAAGFDCQPYASPSTGDENLAGIRP